MRKSISEDNIREAPDEESKTSTYISPITINNYTYYHWRKDPL